ncbi:MAG: (Fe-S)-binding protein [Bacilli bacterium]|jgi:electron transport complex protein RnfB|nr:(Fe-S)-binding protein [Bacilli bacterium]
MKGIVIITLIAFLFSTLLVLTNYFLNRVNRRLEAVLNMLPGYNCGACGFGGCPGMAEQIIKNGVDPKRCKPMKEEQYENIMKYLKEHHIEVKKD